MGRIVSLYVLTYRHIIIHFPYCRVTWRVFFAILISKRWTQSRSCTYFGYLIVSANANSAWFLCRVSERPVYLRRASLHKRTNPANRAGFHIPFSWATLALERGLSRRMDSYAAVFRAHWIFWCYYFLALRAEQAPLIRRDLGWSIDMKLVMRRICMLLLISALFTVLVLIR